jgi:hypothetical protein
MAPKMRVGLNVSCPARDSSLAPTAIAPVLVRRVKVCLNVEDKIQNTQGSLIEIGGILLVGEVVVPTFQTSELAGLQGNGNSRLLGTTGCRRQPILKVNPLETSRNQKNGKFPVASDRTSFI